MASKKSKQLTQDEKDFPITPDDSPATVSAALWLRKNCAYTGRTVVESLADIIRAHMDLRDMSPQKFRKYFPQLKLNEDGSIERIEEDTEQGVSTPTGSNKGKDQEGS